MSGKTIDISLLVKEDRLGTEIANHYLQWDVFRQKKVKEWEEVQRYVFATDTRTTSNAHLPWKNTTTIPKLCQIRDNLYANYTSAIFPKRKWLKWEGSDKDSNEKKKREAIENYMAYAINQDSFKKVVDKLILDYIDYGNAFASIDWEDNTQLMEDGSTKVGYVGPSPVRISPLDIVFNPIAPTFEEAPKIIRKMVSLGEVKKLMGKLSKGDDQESYDELWKYIKDLRGHSGQYSGFSDKTKDTIYSVSGFTDFKSYLQSNTVELLYFYGDIYDQENDVLLENYQIIVADRHKVILSQPNPSYFGTPPIYHVGWRMRQDNLWSMGPLENLVGLQYRIDHIENLKADVFDLLTFPVLKVKGHVEDFKWGPFERIYVGDDGDVEILAPPFQVLQANSEIQTLEAKMEEMAGAPKEALGFRTPGEKTAYEVQRLENAASRIFATKVARFEEHILENTLNGMLELAKRNFGGRVENIKIFDDEFQVSIFQDLTVDDITGSGRLKPFAARHFAERAELIQNVNNFFASPVGQNPEVMVHFSSIKLATMFEELLSFKEYGVVQPYVRLSEQADAQRIAQSSQEQVMMESQTPSGMSEDDYDPDMVGGQNLGLGGPTEGEFPVAEDQ